MSSMGSRVSLLLTSFPRAKSKSQLEKEPLKHQLKRMRESQTFFSFFHSSSISISACPKLSFILVTESERASIRSCESLHAYETCT